MDMQTDIQHMRRFNRFYTGHLGLLGRSILGGPLGLGQARVLFEIGADPDCLAVELAARLNMDKGYLSRMLSGLERHGLVERTRRDADRRGRSLRLTKPGQALLADLEGRSNQQAKDLLSGLEEPARRAALAAMDTLEGALSAARADERPCLREPEPGDLGYVVESHGRLYQQEYGFGGTFEHYVVLGLAEFLQADPDQRRLFVAAKGGRPVGTVAVMPRPEGLAQLRWFLVEPECRNHGTGRELLATALDFARQRGFQGCYLWTVTQIDPARHLYESLGFAPIETKPGSMGGVAVTEERWSLTFPA